MKSSLRALWVLASLPLAVLGQSGSLSGKVIDFADQRGLFGVTVHIDNADGTSVKTFRDVLTEYDGTYEVTGLRQATEYRATFSLEHYEPDIHQVTVTTTYSPVLKKYYASSVYWRKAAETIRPRIQSLPKDQQPAAFTRIWEGLKVSGISAAGKAEIARNLKASLPSAVWSNSSSFQVYSQADPDRLTVLEIAFDKNSDVSRLAGLDPMIFEDIKATQKNYPHVTNRNDDSRQPDLKDPAIKMPNGPQQEAVVPSRQGSVTTTPATSNGSRDGLVKTEGTVKIDGVVKSQAGKIDDSSPANGIPKKQ